MTLSERLECSRPLVMDGAINTQLDKKGLRFSTTDWLRVNLDHPEVLWDIHAEYARAGARLHIANSFSSTRHVLARHGMEQDYEALNRAAVEICRAAVTGETAQPQWIAASMSSYAVGFDRESLPPAAALERNFAEQADILASAGCDLIALEMLYDEALSAAMLKGAQTAGLPISLGFVCTLDTSRGVLLDDSGRGRGQAATLAGVLPRLLDMAREPAGVIVSVMHCEVGHISRAIAQVRRHWDGALAVYPNVGACRATGDWDTDAGPDPGKFAEACVRWVSEGAAMVGGCCGSGPAHIRAVAQRLSAPSP